MSDCCTPGQGFPNAALMQQIALNSPIVWQEICAIQQAVLSASSGCQPGGSKLCITVGGTTPMTFVSGIKQVTVLSGGTGYYVDRPSVVFVPPVGRVPSIVATADVVTNGGSILSIDMTNYGEGYQPVNSTLSVGSVAGVDAVLEPIVSATGGIMGVNIIDAGQGYQVNDSVVPVRAVTPTTPLTNAELHVSAVSPNGEILSVSVTKTGQGYQPSTASVEIVSSLNSTYEYPAGAGFKGTPVVNGQGQITQVIIENTGGGYGNLSPYLAISNQGTGAVTSVSLDGTSVSSISVLASGSGYNLPVSATVYNPVTAPLPNPPVDSANILVEINENTYGTNPQEYWNVWAGATTNKIIQLQINQVLSYFTQLGYTIKIMTNPETGNTIQWVICW